MADPLSVAASIIGILGAAAKITETVQPLISNTRNAPKLALQVYREVNSVRMVLASLETVLKDLGTPSAQTTARHIQVDYVVVLLTDGVLLFSELDALLAPLKAPDTGQSNPQMPLRQRALWATKKGDISVIIGQMQNFFAALSAMFNMFHCQSEMAIMTSQTKLEGTVTALLARNDALVAKVQRLERGLRRGARTSMSSDATPRASFNYMHADASLTSQSLESTLSEIRFQSSLLASRVYRRVKRAESLISFDSSNLGSAAWSIFSGLSLSDMSVLSAIALPLYQSDITNAESYEFGEEPDLSRVQMELEFTNLRLSIADWKHLDVKNFGALLLVGDFHVNVEGFSNGPVSGVFEKTRVYLFQKMFLAVRHEDSVVSKKSPSLATRCMIVYDRDSRLMTAIDNSSRSDNLKLSLISFIPSEEDDVQCVDISFADQALCHTWKTAINLNRTKLRDDIKYLDGSARELSQRMLDSYMTKSLSKAAEMKEKENTGHIEVVSLRPDRRSLQLQYPRLSFQSGSWVLHDLEKDGIVGPESLTTGESELATDHDTRLSASLISRILQSTPPPADATQATISQPQSSPKDKAEQEQSKFMEGAVDCEPVAEPAPAVRTFTQIVFKEAPLDRGKKLERKPNRLQRKRLSSGNQVDLTAVVPPMPDNYDPSIRGRIVHDFDAPRPRPGPCQPTLPE